MIHTPNVLAPNGDLVTVIVPTFNGAKLIRECLESVLRQDYKSIEVIVVDGASTDNTVEIVSILARGNPFISCTSKPDLGVYDAINRGLRLARGEWIYILGCDDRLAGQGVFTAIAPFLATDNDIIHTKVLRMSTGLLEGAPSTPGDIVLNNICQQAILYRKSLFTRLGEFDLKYKICADWDFNIRCFGLPCKVTFCDVVLCHYDGRGMSSRTTDHAFYRDRLSIALRAYHVPVLHSVFRALRYEFHDEGKKCLEEGRIFHAVKNQTIFFIHAVIAKFERLMAPHSSKTR
ncbi:glycosyltransferase family 2 protein [Rhodoferax sp.]|uniref:glycosyltransferase family 2 protein n=1 Tax=Rhodoferax sp. TaxID=50421 RepID=UPI002847D30E|nr:glycosyltransferase family 2 protein [Rhodoferax sp.]MDR3368499.1 glycosyltransferase family 2 protein [Rhodoferax sp.]